MRGKKAMKGGGVYFRRNYTLFLYLLRFLRKADTAAGRESRRQTVTVKNAARKGNL